MPKEISDATIRRLIAISLIYRQALHRSERKHNAVENLMAVIEFDLSVESTLRLLIVELGGSLGSKDQFPELMKKTSTLLGDRGLRPVNEAGINSSHVTRNGAQHEGRFPSESDVLESRFQTTAFLESVIPDVFGKSLAEFSLIDVIQNDVLRTRLELAYKNIEDGGYPESVSNCRSAMYITSGLPSQCNLRLDYPQAMYRSLDYQVSR
jgi:hypothetical protein